jgi:non-specific serine/threonine protein kinase
VAAFARGSGHGLLHLGAVELGAELSPALAYWRAFARGFVGAACAAVNPLDPAVAVIPAADGARIEALALAVPPMLGGELVDGARLHALWAALGRALVERAAEHEGGAQGFFQAAHPVWCAAGRVCLHLAENKRDAERPFAFIATYARARDDRPELQHVPLSRALQEFAGAKSNEQLLALLVPLRRAAERSALVRGLLDSGEVYHPLAWTAEEAHALLCEAEALEAAGLVLRLPQWWGRARRPRAAVKVTVGDSAPSTLGLGALLDFDVQLTLGGETLTEAEASALLSASAGLLFIKGQWVEVVPDQLAAVLDRWRQAQARAAAEGLSFGEAMRLLAGAAPGERLEAAEPERAGWSEVVAGGWLRAQLEALRSPEVSEIIAQNAGLDAQLRPYQQVGVQWLWTLHGLGLGGCLADDMGLGKTIQVIGLLSLLHAREAAVDLLIVPASLLDNWSAELARFAPGLRVLVAHPSRMPAAALKALDRAALSAHQLVITTYATALTAGWMKAQPWRALILDEAQAIKNPGAKQTRAIKALPARWRLALTGTPVENRLGDLWSLFDFLNPGLLGDAKAFNGLCQTMAARPGDGFAPLRRLVAPYVLRRLKTDPRIIADLPDKTELTAHCLLSKAQAALYVQAVAELQQTLREASGLARRGAVLAALLRLKQICNHPSQWLGDGGFAPEDSGKLQRLSELCEPIRERQQKVLVFTQFRAMTEPLQRHLAACLGRPGLVLDGGTPVKQRAALVERFQNDEEVAFMVLSLKAGGTGLNLTAANHVIHFDRWWNPAVENQATDRAYRIGQRRDVLVHKFVCKGTVEERIDQLIANKQRLSDGVLVGEGEAELKLTELSDDALLALVRLDLQRAVSA